MKEQNERLLQFIIQNQGDYEKCIGEIDAFALRRRIEGIRETTGDNEIKFIDKELPIIRLTDVQKPNDRKEYEPINPRIHGQHETPEG
jgi:hypothetical protein